MRDCSYFKNIDNVLVPIKSERVQNIERKNDFQETGLPLPPCFVITRWANCFIAELYYYENLPAIFTIANNWTSGGLLVSQTKDFLM